MPDGINVERIVVRPGRLICDVCVSDPAQRYVTPELAKAACEAYPSLPHHTCINDKGPTFGHVLETTSVPHLLEHIALDIQTRAATDDQTTFIGTTEWLDESAGKARIELSFTDDAQALRSFNQARTFIIAHQ